MYLIEKTRKSNRDRFDTLSIPRYVIKKGPLHGARHGNTEGQRIYHAAHNAAKRARKREINPSWTDFKIVQLTESQLAIGWDEAFCTHYDEISKEDHAYECTAEEHKIRENSWVLVLDSQGKKRSDETT